MCFYGLCAIRGYSKKFWETERFSLVKNVESYFELPEMPAFFLENAELKLKFELIKY